MKLLSKKLVLIATGAGIGAVSQFAAAQASGVDVTSTVTSINNVTPSIVAIGGAVLAVVVVAWGYKTVKGFLGR